MHLKRNTPILPHSDITFSLFPKIRIAQVEVRGKRHPDPENGGDSFCEPLPVQPTIAEGQILRFAQNDTRRAVILNPSTVILSVSEGSQGKLREGSGV